jgi:hypothetical protein
MTWESQRSADAICDRAEIIAPFLSRMDSKAIQAGNELIGSFSSSYANRELCLADEEKGPQVTQFYGVRALRGVPESVSPVRRGFSWGETPAGR